MSSISFAAGTSNLQFLLAPTRILDLPTLSDSDPNLSGKVSVNPGCVRVKRHVLKNNIPGETNETQWCVIVWKQKAEHNLTGEPSGKKCVRVCEHMSKKSKQELQRTRTSGEKKTVNSTMRCQKFVWCFENIIACSGIMAQRTRQRSTSQPESRRLSGALKTFIMCMCVAAKNDPLVVGKPTTIAVPVQNTMHGPVCKHQENGKYLFDCGSTATITTKDALHSTAAAL